jgi:hypothetical protein
VSCPVSVPPMVIEGPGHSQSLLALFRSRPPPVPNAKMPSPAPPPATPSSQGVWRVRRTGHFWPSLCRVSRSSSVSRHYFGDGAKVASSQRPLPIRSGPAPSRRAGLSPTRPWHVPVNWKSGPNSIDDAPKTLPLTGKARESFSPGTDT